jgi:hypothetical protein
VGYLDDIAAMRAERQGRELYEQLQQIQRDHAENLRMRDEAQGQGDRESWDFYDREAEQLEQQYARIAPPQQFQIPQSVTEFVQEHAPFFERYGAPAYQALDVAAGYAMRPFNPASRNLATTGVGMSPDSPDFKDTLTSLFELYAGEFGLHFDKNEKVLTPEEASDLSGVSRKEYNKQLRAVFEGGHDQFSRSGQMWNRKVG